MIRIILSIKTEHGKMLEILLMIVMFLSAAVPAVCGEGTGRKEMKYEYTIPSEGDGNRGIYFKNLHDIYCDKGGSLYLIDWKLSSIVKYDADGNYVGKIGRLGQAPGEYLSPQHISVDDKGNIILYEYGNGRIQILEPNGTYISSFKTYKYCERMAFYDGKIYVTNTSPDPKVKLIDIMDTSGNKVGEFGQEKRLEVRRYRDINNKYLSIDPSGNVFLGWDYFPWIHKYNKKGELIGKIELSLPYYQEREKQNLKMAKTVNKEPMYYQIICAMIVDGDNICTLSTRGEITINVFTGRGALKTTYWTKPPKEKKSYDAMAIRKVGMKKYIYLASNYPECGVDVYSVND